MWPSVVAYRWWLLAAIAVVLVVTLVRTRREDWLRWRDRLLGRDAVRHDTVHPDRSDGTVS